MIIFQVLAKTLRGMWVRNFSIDQRKVLVPDGVVFHRPPTRWYYDSLDAWQFFVLHQRQWIYVQH